MGVSENKQPLTEKDKEVASHLIENETVQEHRSRCAHQQYNPGYRNSYRLLCVQMTLTTLATELSDLSIKP